MGAETTEEKLEEVQEELEVASEKTVSVGQLVLDALALAEKSLEATRKALAEAVHKAKDAETVLRMLKGQVRHLQKKIHEISKEDVQH